jgi:outer membrane immunogenic protein
MKSLWIKGVSLAALAALGASAANAADLPTRKEAPAYIAPIPLYNWTGFYAGVNVGGIWENGGTSISGSPLLLALPPGSIPSDFGGGGSGWLGGAQIGYNYQYGQAVFGIETDIDATSLDHSSSFTGVSIGGPGTLTWNESSRLDWIGTTRLRAGMAFAPENRALAYLTGGFAYGGGSTSSSIYSQNLGYVWSGSNNPVRTGWTLGGGLEYAVTNNISLRGEYLYYDLGSKTVTANGNAAVLAGAPGYWGSAKTDFNGSIFRVGLNYKFW